MTPAEAHRRYRWRLAQPMPAAIQQATAGLHPLLAQVLHGRGLRDGQQMAAFLDGHYLESRDPFLLAGMEAAVARVQQAIDADEQIVVYGDFDADGVTATVLLVESLRGLGLERRQVVPYIPHRVDEGYGLNVEALHKLRQAGAGLVITVDCGIRSLQEVEAANAVGLDVIITDHHSLGRRLPAAAAVINPKLPESRYPERMLAGVGIAFKLAQALRLRLPDRATFDEADLLDLVALGTVADLAPLRGENRRLVQEGLQVLNSLRRPGVDALARVAGLRPGAITAESIAFGLGPRLNAAGRLDNAYEAARLLAANNSRAAGEHAEKLNRLNRARQGQTAQLTREAEARLDPSAPLLLIADPSFKPGLVGLVAGRLTEKYYRPAVVVEQGPAESRGSCRSIPEFNITHALDQLADLLERYGGHAQAAGFTIRNERLEEFGRRLTALAAEQLDLDALQPAVHIDAELSLSDVDWALKESLDRLEPTGTENAAPRFLSRAVQVLSHRAVGQDGSHLQLNVSDGWRGFKAIAFRQAGWAGHLPARVDLVYGLNVNEFNGRRDLELVVEDIGLPEPAPAGRQAEPS
ncbi:MAG: single-stranded-DNA-specific exonuclease RecJ [Candidatus Promineifilaceae bacterium]